jgi:hypothetical protein
MAGDNTRYNVPFRAPALPYPPKMYDAKSFEDFTANRLHVVSSILEIT